MMSENFVVRLDADRFVREKHEREILCTDDRAQAKTFSQEDATALAAKLRRRGFPRASVVEQDGAARQSVFDADQARINRFWGD
jgi:hypothetical protein